MDEAPIVIGFDGSIFAFEALRKGLWVASKVGAPALVVRAWTVSNAPRPKTWAPGYVPPVEDFTEAVIEQVKSATAPVIAEFPAVQVTYEAPHGAAGRELVRVSEGARMVVVGTRGQGGFKGLLLGSVSDQVVEHAKCDVLVIRPKKGDQAPPRTQRLDQVIEPMHP